MRFDMSSLSDEELGELVGITLGFHPAAPRAYRALQDACMAEQVARQHARRHARPAPSGEPVEVVLEVRPDELRRAMRCLLANTIAAERCGFPRAAQFLRTAFDDLVELGAATMEASQSTSN